MRGRDVRAGERWAMCDRCAVVVRYAMRGRDVRLVVDARAMRTWAVGERDRAGCAVVVRDAMRDAMRGRCTGCDARRDAMRGPLRTGCIYAMWYAV